MLGAHAECQGGLKDTSKSAQENSQKNGVILPTCLSERSESNSRTLSPRRNPRKAATHLHKKST